VDAAAIGGILARESVQGRPVHLRFEEREMEIAFFRPIRTAGVIRSLEWKRKVNEAGGRALSSMFSEGRPTWEGFIASSRDFSMRSGLGMWAVQEMADNPRASMAMLGRTLFCDTKLALRRTPLKLMKTRLSEQGAQML
jgi:pantoate kinase